MKALITSALLLCGLDSSTRQVESRSNPLVGAYYFNMFAMTVRGIDSAQIERYYDLTSLLKNSAPKLVELLKAPDLPSKGVAEDHIRLKLVFSDGQIVLMDRLGNVSGLGKPHRLSEATMKKARKFIYSAFPDEWPVDRKS